MAVYTRISKKSSFKYLILLVTTQLKGFFSDDSRMSSQKSQQLLSFPSIMRTSLTKAVGSPKQLHAPLEICVIFSSLPATNILTFKN